MMELIQTAHLSGQMKVTLKMNGMPSIMILKKTLLQSMVMKKKIMTHHQTLFHQVLKIL